jgi:glycerol dehydrogenase-like iron-containing ADH family enzyme
VADFGGDSTHEESGRVREIIVSNNCDLAVGIGSGKVLDTSKASEPKLESDL